MTVIYVLVNGIDDVSNDVVEADIWRETLTGIGRFEVDIVNGDGVTNINPYGNTWTPDMRIVIAIDGVTMMCGYIDDINNYLDEGGYYTQMIKIRGRDHGMDLAQHYITANYQIQPADDIVQAARAVIPSEILYPSPGLAPSRAYEFDRTYLADGIREIAEKIDYDFYVTNATPPVLSFFSIAAAVDTGVDLLMDIGGATNNILRFDRGERLGLEIKNNIEIHMGGVKDHWSDENAQPAIPPPYGWIGMEADGFTSVNNVRAAPPPFAPLIGRSVIEWERTTLGVGAGASTHSMCIDFSAAAAAPWTNVSDYYGYAGGSINLSERNDCHVMMRTDAGGALVIIRPVLIDNTAPNPNVIWFYAMLGIAVPTQDDERQGYGPTDDLLANKWYRLKFPVGDDLNLYGALTNQAWSHVPAGAAPLPQSAGLGFNWSNVEQIWFVSVNNQNPCYYWIDDLTIPGVEARYYRRDAVSAVAYGERMYHEFRGDLGSQVQAVQLGENLIAKKKDPLRTITLTVGGDSPSQTGIIYPGMLLDVRAPSHGIPALTKYRIVKLHHSVAVSPDRAKIRGYDFITELELIQQQISGVDTPYSSLRLERNVNPGDGQFEALNKYSRRLMSTKWARER